MHWHVLGRGAVGCLWAAHLARSGQTVTLLVRSPAPPTATPIRVEDAWRAAAGGAAKEGPAAWEQRVSVESVADAPAGAEIRNLLVATKAQDAGRGVGSLAARLAERPTVVLLQNGLGAADDVLADATVRAKRPLLLLGSTTQGGYVRDPYDVVHAGYGLTWLGPSKASLAAWAAEGGEDGAAQAEARFQEAAASLSSTELGALTLETAAAMEGRLWGKLAINAALNPQTALLRCRNGEIIATPEGLAAIRSVCLEVAEVMAASGLRTLAGDESGDVAELGEALVGFTIDAAERNAQNFSSMYQDATAGRATEGGDINGAVVRLAEELGVAVPHNAMLLRQMRMLESANRSAAAAAEGSGA